MTEPIADGTSLKVTLGGQLRELQRWVYATPLIIVACIGIYVWQAADLGDGKSMLRGGVVADWGDQGSAVSDGQWWRAFTGTWLHINLLHLGGNLFALAIIGRSVERMIGWRGFAIMYVLAGLGGSFATYLVMPHSFSIGASGAIYGVFGCVVGFTVRYPGKFPSQGLRTLMWAGLAYLLYTTAFSMGPRINWAAHAGGFIAGVACGAALSAPIEPHALPGRRWRDARLALVGAVVVAGALFALQGRITSWSDAVVDVFAADARLATDVTSAFAAGDGPVRDTIDARITPDLAARRAELAALDSLPEGQRRVLDVVDRYLVQRERAWSMVRAGFDAGDFDVVETGRALHASADAAAAELHETLARLVDEPLTAPVPIAPALDPAIAALVATP